MHPRVLIVGTVPYNEKSTSRAFDAYFHYWEKENLAQIFSNTKTPVKGHCGELYQITDYRMLYRRLHKTVETGKLFLYNELPDAWSDNDLELNNKAVEKAYKIGRTHSPLTHLLRGFLWQKKYWCTPRLNAWLDKFSPECVFLSFSDDYFIPQIAYYVAQRFDIPIISSIGDDYFFNKHFSLDPIYQVYKESYKALIRKVLAWKGSAIYISDKIRDKYNKEFNLNGKTVYLSSDICRKAFRPIDKRKPLIAYFGNIRMGRNESLCEIATALLKINSDYRLQVFSNEEDEKYYRMLRKHPGIIYGGSIPYSEVKEKMESCDITVIVEGFKQRDVEQSRYSLSTKAADALASGAAILAFGSIDCGIIEYMQMTQAAVVCTEGTELETSMRRLIYDVDLQKQLYKQAVLISKKHHSLDSSTAIFEQLVQNVIKENKDAC